MNNFIPGIRAKHLSLYSNLEGFIKEVKDADILIVTDDDKEVIIPKNESRTFDNSEFNYEKHYGYYKLHSEIKKKLKEFFPKGTRIMLRKMDDFQAPPLGTLGTVKGVDDIANLLVQWDNGSSLSIIFGEDIVEKI